jgi:hypothetical protein
VSANQEIAMGSDESVELVIKLQDGIGPESSQYHAVKSKLRDLGVHLGEHASSASSSFDSYRSVIVPRGVASRAVEALKGNAAVEGAFVKPRGETP